MNKLAWILAVWVALGAVAVQAEEPAPIPGIEWDILDESQQQLLESQKETWDSLPPGRQQAMAEGSERWLSMTPDQRKTAQERFGQWRELSPWHRFLSIWKTKIRVWNPASDLLVRSIPTAATSIITR